MNRVLILGAGLVTKPAVDYFLDVCKYEVIIATRTSDRASKIIAGRSLGKAVSWTFEQLDDLDKLVSQSDLVLSLLPPTMHIPVAEACLKNRVNMVTTSYISPQMQALDEAARKKDIIILNEIGEDPGLDHMGAKKVIDAVHAEGGKVVELKSFGAGLPAFENNNNPFGYKFSWSPRGVMMAAQSPAAYLKNGERIDVAAKDLFDHHWLYDVEGVGTFETYPNRDSTRYADWFGLDKDVSLYRGLLRFCGWCNTLKYIIALNLAESYEERDFSGMTYAQLVTERINSENPENIIQQVAEHLNLFEKSDILERLKWLGIFDDKEIGILKGTVVDVLVDLMLKKLSYKPGEKDMIIIHDEVTAEFPDRTEKRFSSMRVEGIPHGDSAMSRAVSLPAAIAARHIIEGNIKAKGVQMPVLKEIYEPVLMEMEEFGFVFNHSLKTI